MKTEHKQLLKAMLVHLIGVMLLGFGIAIFVTAQLGSDPITVLADGVHQVFSITIGSAMIFLNGVVLLVVFLFRRSYIRIGTWISAIMTGVFVDIFILLISQPLQTVASLPGKLLVLLVGCAVIGLGIALYLSADIGVSLGDLICLILTTEKGWQYRWIKITLDFSFVAIGFSLGGKVGLGTIVGALVVGPLVQVFMPFAKKVCI
ncbi:MAG: YitT family protein [Angelakisella sp.]